jgi:hypothetical protein
MQPNQQAHQQQAPPPPPPHQPRLAEILRTRPTTFSQAKDPMEVEDWLKGVEKKLMFAQCTNHEKVFAAHQLFGMTANWWETYCNPVDEAEHEALTSGAYDTIHEFASSYEFSSLAESEGNDNSRNM